MEVPGKWEVVEVDVDEPREREVLLRYAATGLCHSDDHHAIGDSGTQHLPYCGGHEGAGVVEAVGPGVSTLKPGDHAAFIPGCGRCRWCASGMQNLCDLGALIPAGAMIDGTYRMHHEGRDVAQAAFVGTFSEWAVVPELCCIPIGKDIPLPVRQHRALRHARGAGGVGQQRRLLRVRRSRGRALPGQAQLVERGAALDRLGREDGQPGNHAAGVGENRDQPGLGDDEPGAGVDDRVHHLGRGEPDVEQLDGDADAERRVHRLDELDLVGHQDAEYVAGTQAGPVELVGSPIEPGPGVLALGEPDGEVVREPSRPEAQQLREVAAHDETAAIRSAS
jgi:hypothetical protein